MRVGRLISQNCSACKTLDCCKISGSPFVLTEYDIKRIASYTDLPEEEFVEEQKCEGERYKALKSTADGTCIFFDKERHDNKRCRIYRVRPLDCHLFPFSFTLITNKVSWIRHLLCSSIYRNKHQEEILQRAETYILPHFSPRELSDFARLNTDHPALHQFEILREVSLKTPEKPIG